MELDGTLHLLTFNLVLPGGNPQCHRKSDMTLQVWIHGNQWDSWHLNLYQSTANGKINRKSEWQATLLFIYFYDQFTQKVSSVVTPQWTHDTLYTWSILHITMSMIKCMCLSVGFKLVFIWWWRACRYSVTI